MPGKKPSKAKKEQRMRNYSSIANEIRKTVLSMIYKAQVSHIGSNFSCIDVLTVLYARADFKKDKIVVSKGWVAASIYALNVKYDLMSWGAIDTFCNERSKYIGLIEPLGVFGAEFAGGSMGMGLPAAVGFALAKKLKKEDGTIYVLMSDGEMQCGTTWESAMIAAHHKLDNLEIWCDFNFLQAMGKVKDILDIEPLAKKWQAFGWRIYSINGHDFQEIQDVLALKKEKPTIIICKTEKGYPISFMRGNNIFHYKAPSEEEYNLALKELNG